MKNSELFQLSFQFLVNYENLEIVTFFRENILKNEVLLFKFIHLSSNHLVLPAIYRRLQKTGLSDELPVELSLHLNEILQKNIKRNEEILQQIDEISTNLYKKDIEPVFLKGTANLLDGLYSDSADRMIGDIDFLVKEKDYFRAADEIKKSGYRQNEGKILVDLDSLTHYPRLYRNDVPADIEIHRTPVIDRYGKKFNSNTIFDKKKSIPDQKNCFVTCDEHKLIHTFIHGQLSNMGYAFRIVTLRDLYDFYLILKRTDIDSVLPEIEERKKADIFFKLVKFMSDPGIDVSFDKSKTIHKKIRQFNWFLNHPKQHRAHINLIKIIDIFIQRPFIKIRDAFLNKASRKGFFKRIKNPDWYLSTFKGIRSIFK